MSGKNIKYCKGVYTIKLTLDGGRDLLEISDFKLSFFIKQNRKAQKVQRLRITSESSSD